MRSATRNGHRPRRGAAAWPAGNSSGESTTIPGRAFPRISCGDREEFRRLDRPASAAEARGLVLRCRRACAPARTPARSSPRSGAAAPSASARFRRHAGRPATRPVGSEGPRRAGGRTTTIAMLVDDDLASGPRSRPARKLGVASDRGPRAPPRPSAFWTRSASCRTPSCSTSSFRNGKPGSPSHRHCAPATWDAGWMMSANGTRNCARLCEAAGIDCCPSRSTRRPLPAPLSPQRRPLTLGTD